MNATKVNENLIKEISDKAVEYHKVLKEKDYIATRLEWAYLENTLDLLADIRNYLKERVEND